MIVFIVSIAAVLALVVTLPLAVARYVCGVARLAPVRDRLAHGRYELLCHRCTHVMDMFDAAERASYDSERASYDSGLCSSCRTPLRDKPLRDKPC